MRFFNRAAALAAVLALAACGGEPSEDDIRGAIQAQMDTANAQAASLAGNNKMAQDMLKGMTSKLESVKKHACAKDGPGYRCDVTVSVSGGLTGAQSAATSVRLTKTDKGWAILQ